MPRKKKEKLVHLDMDELVQTASSSQDVASAQTLGDILKQARQKKHLDISDISKSSCIKPVYIEALEQGHYYVFPAKAYAIGFLRTYAKMLKLNPEEMVALYHQETSDNQEQPLDMLVIEKKAALPSKKALIITLCVLFVFYIIWYLIANAYAPASLASDDVPVTQEQSVIEEPVVEEILPPVKEVESVKVVEKVIKEIADEVYTAPIAFVATDRVWVSIKNSQTNKVLIDKTFIKNEHYIPSVPLENLSVSTGRGGVFDLYLNGIRTQTFKKEDNTPLIGLTKD